MPRNVAATGGCAALYSVMGLVPRTRQLLGIRAVQKTPNSNPFNALEFLDYDTKVFKVGRRT